MYDQNFLKLVLIKLFALFCSIERMNVLYSQLPMEARMLQSGILSSLEVGDLCYASLSKQAKTTIVCWD